MLTSPFRNTKYSHLQSAVNKAPDWSENSGLQDLKLQTFLGLNDRKLKNKDIFHLDVQNTVLSNKIELQSCPTTRINFTFQNSKF